MEGAAELHRFWWSVRVSSVVDWVPRVVAEKSWASLALHLDRGWRQLKAREVTDFGVGQDDPEATVDEVGHFVAKEFGMLGRGLVAAARDATVQLFGSPRLGGGEYGDTVVPPIAQKG